jgi:hypothetical protein
VSLNDGNNGANYRLTLVGNNLSEIKAAMNPNGAGSAAALVVALLQTVADSSEPAAQSPSTTSAGIDPRKRKDNSDALVVEGEICKP